VAQMGVDASEERLEFFLIERLVGLAPVDVRLTARLAHEVFVLRRTPRVFAGADYERAGSRGDAFAPPNRLFVKRGGDEVAGSAADWSESEIFQSDRFTGQQCHEGNSSLV